MELWSIFVRISVKNANHFLSVSRVTFGRASMAQSEMRSLGLLKGNNVILRAVELQWVVRVEIFVKACIKSHSAQIFSAKQFIVSETIHLNEIAHCRLPQHR
jgi:hypothetical protein